jgi:hypothetical protein
MKATSNQQEPFVYGSLGGDVVSLVPAPEPKAASTPADNIGDTRRDYEFFQQVGTREAWNDFLQLHPTGPYANLARAQLSKLIDAEKKSADEAKAAEKAAIEKAAAERAAAEKKAAAEKAAAEQAKAEQAAEKAAIEKAVAEKDAAANEAIAAKKAKVKVAVTSSDTPPQSATPAVPGPAKKDITTQDKTPPTRKIATRHIDEEQPSWRRHPTPTPAATVDTCTKRFAYCTTMRSKQAPSLNRARGRLYGSCEQRRTTCLSSGIWTGPRGVHSVARR